MMHHLPLCSYERCVSAAALSLHAIVTLFAEQQQVEKLSDANASLTLASVVSSDKFGRLATASSKHASFSRDVVRRAVYKALHAVVTHAPAIVRAREESFGKVILGVVGDKSPANHEAMWNVVLSFLQTYPSVWRVSSSFPKFATSVMVPRLFSLIRHGFYGSARISFPTLLPLLSLVPLDAMGDSAKGGECTLYTGVLEQCLKFLESDAARFNERNALNAFFECATAYFSVFLDADVSAAWLERTAAAVGSVDAVAAKYVGQFEKPVKAALTLVLATSSSSATTSDANVELFVANLVTMLARLRIFTPKKCASDVAQALQTAFVDKLHVWIRDVVISAIQKRTVEPTRVNELVRTGFNEATTKFLSADTVEWTQTAVTIYRECLTQLQVLRTSDPSSGVPVTAARDVGQLVVLMRGVYETIGLDATLSHVSETSESSHAHFASEIRAVVQSAPTWTASQDSAVQGATRALLQLCRHFFIAVCDKKQFLLDVFQDFGVQYGDMRDATMIVKHMLEFAVSADGSQHWLASGSWSDASATSNPEASTAVAPELEALRAVWDGKLLDEFLLISLKGRLDDVDADAFAALLTASLGGDAHLPVVSPDAVVILGHFALQTHDSAAHDDVLMRVLPNLLQLFANISRRDDDSDAHVVLPRELATVEQKLYERLFYLTARGAYRTDASALWASLALPSMQRWDAPQKLAFVDTLAHEINALLVAATPADTPFNSHQFSAFVKQFLLLGDAQDALVATSVLASKLDVLHMRCPDDASTRARFVDRVLPTLGEICDSERMAALLGAYYATLFVEDPAVAVPLVQTLVDMDVAHSLTWFVFHADASAAHDALLDARIEILQHYLTLEPLYDELKRASPVLARVLETLVSDPSTKAPTAPHVDTAMHRTLLFTHKHSDNTVASTCDQDALTPTQSEDLDSLVVAALASYVSPVAKAALLQKLLDENFAWASRAGLVLVQPLIVSLLKDDWAADSADAPAILASLTAFIEKLAASAQASAQFYFQFVRLAGACWRHVCDEHAALAGLFQATAYTSILTRMESVLRPNAYASVETSEWILLTEFLSALPTWRVCASPEDQDKWEAVAKMAITHIIAGKQDVAKVTALKLHQRSSGIRDTVEDEQLVLEYPHELLRARLAMLALLRAIQRVNSGSALASLSPQYRETLLSIVLCALSEGVELKAHVVTTYVTTASALQSYDLVQLSLGVEESLVLVLHALHGALASVSDVDRVKELVLAAFGGVEGLATLFDADKYPMSPKLRALLYILASHCGALKLRAFDASAIDINADDEAATEAALAKSVIPRAVRKALELEFATVPDVQMKRRKQKPQERDDIMGRLLLWDLFLQLFPTSAASSNTPTMIASALSSYAQQKGLLTNFLTFCSSLLAQESALSRSTSKLVLQDAHLFHISDLANGLETSWANDKASVYQLGARVFFRTVLRLPAMVRTWWNDECSRSLRSWAGKYFEEVRHVVDSNWCFLSLLAMFSHCTVYVCLQHITPFILASELDVIQSASQTHSWDADEMSVKGSRVSREITTTYVKDECALEMVIRVPASYPLRSVEVECTKRIGISEDRWRRWVLQIIKVTASQDGSLLDAVLLWKKNVDKEFEGVEPCPICYSILNPKTMGLPNLPCKTCSNKYHNSCLYKWFNQSGKNKCPICQQPFH